MNGVIFINFASICFTNNNIFLIYTFIKFFSFLSPAGSCTGWTGITAQFMWWSWMGATRRNCCRDTLQIEITPTLSPDLVLWLSTLNMGIHTHTHTENLWLTLKPNVCSCFCLPVFSCSHSFASTFPHPSFLHSSFAQMAVLDRLGWRSIYRQSWHGWNKCQCNYHNQAGVA